MIKCQSCSLPNDYFSASDGVHEGQTTVNVNVSNVFDEAPTLHVENPLDLLEELPVDTALGGIYEVTEIEENDILTYTLEGNVNF